LALGEVSEPFRSRFGMHLAVVTDLRMRDIRGEDDAEKAKQRIRYELREEQLERVYGQWVRGLRSEAFVDIRVDDLF